MGGSYDVPKPDDTLAMMQVQTQGALGAQALKNRSALLEQMSTQPLESWTPDIFSPQGMLTKAGMIAATNAYKSKELEQSQNPAAAKARENIMQRAADYTDKDYWQKQMDQWSRSKGLAESIQNGTGDSTFAKSALFDRATRQGQEFDAANIQRAQGIIGQAPMAGIDPGQALNAMNAAQAKAVQDRGAYRNAMYAGAGANQQGTMDWINQIMGSSSQAVNAHDQNWQNYKQAMIQGAANKDAATGSYIGSGVGAAATIGAAAIMV